MKTAFRRVRRFVANLRLHLILGSLLFAAAPFPGLFAQQPPTSRPIKLVLARRSTADPVEIMKHLGEKCPNISLTTNPKNSDYMLYAGGWSGGYRFLVIAKGGDTIYATETVLLSNAVKNVCKFFETRR